MAAFDILFGAVSDRMLARPAPSALVRKATILQLVFDGAFSIKSWEDVQLCGGACSSFGLVGVFVGRTALHGRPRSCRLL